MSLCDCPEAPRCATDWCSDRADWSVWLHGTKSRPETPKFMCCFHTQAYRKAMTTNIRGIDKPEGADDDWRPSLLDMIRHGEIALAFNRRNESRRR